MPNALIQAIQDNNNEVFMELLAFPGLEDLINYRDLNGNTPLINAIIGQSLKMASQLIRTNKCDLNIENNSGNTAMIFCIYNIQEHKTFQQIFNELIKRDNIITENDLNLRNIFADFAYAVNHELTPGLYNYYLTQNILLPTERVEFMRNYFSQENQGQHQSESEEFDNNNVNQQPINQPCNSYTDSHLIYNYLTYLVRSTILMDNEY